MDYTILNNGDLLITIEEDEKDNLLDTYGNVLPDTEITTALEPLFCNGLHYVLPEHVGALTDAPLISDTCPYGDNSEVDCEDCSIWWFPNYMIENCLDTLYNTGQVIFKKGS